MAEEAPKKTPAEETKWFEIEGSEKTALEFCTWMDEQREKHPVVLNFHGKWKEMISWREGDQYTYWDKDEQRVKPANLVTRKAKIVVNLIKPLVETLDSKISFNHSAVGVPNSGEMRDIGGAQVATKLLGANDYSNDVSAIFALGKYDFLSTGQFCLAWEWDTDSSGTVAPLKDGKANHADRTKAPGEVRCRLVPIFNIRQDPAAKTPEDCRWYIEYMEVPRQELFSKYPKSEEALKVDAGAGEDPRASKYRGMNVSMDEVDENTPTLIVGMFTEKPSKKYKKGRRILTCEKVVLEAGDNKNPDHELQYFPFFYYQTPYHFWCYGPIYYVQDSQRQINRLVSMAVEHVESWRAKLQVPKGGIKVAGSLTVDSFEVLEVDEKNGQVRAVPMPLLSPEVGALRDFLISSMDRTSNVHEVSYSRLPEYASRAPAQLYDMMLEQENLKLDPMIERNNKTMRRMDTFRLKLMDKYYDMPRMTRVVGPNKTAAIAYFESADLNQNFDVRIERGISLYRGQTMALKLFMELYQNKILTEDDRPKILKALKLGEAETLIRSDMADTEKAMRENQSFIDGTWAKPMDKGGVWLFIHDDHSLHMEHHTDLLKSEEFTRWPIEQQQALYEHNQAHFVIQLALTSGAMNPVTGQMNANPAAGGLPGQQAAAAGQASAGDTLEGQGASAPVGRPPNPAGVTMQPAAGGGTAPPMV